MTPQVQILFLALSPVFGSTLSAGTQDTAPEPTRDPAITAAELEAHVSYLASDELQGRRVGSDELNRAAHYLAAEFKSYGLEPAGDEGSFLQEMFFEIKRYESLPELTLLNRVGERFSAVYGEDFRIRRPGASGTFGIVAVGEEGDLPESPGAEIALCLKGMSYGKAGRRLEELGVPDGDGYGLVISFLRRPGKATTTLPRSSGRPRLSDPGTPSMTTPWIELAPAWEERILSGELGRAELDLHYSRELKPSYNVIARLPGRGTEARSELAQEAIVVSAHYDHIGLTTADRVKTPEDGSEPDLIRNGADDDASGVACVLEMAHKFALEGPQARELVFLLATAEEIGIVGTKYYLDHPSTPLERTVANLNFEMIGRPDEQAGGAGQLWLTGHERTNLMATYQANGLKIVPDPYPKENFFVRSDNIVFCYRGIVGQTFSTYNLHKDYHQVSDEADKLDYEHMQSATVAGFEGVRLVADGTITPEWLEGGQPKPRRR